MRLKSPARSLALGCLFSIIVLQSKLFGIEGSGSEGLNLVVSVEGQVNVKRKGWTGYAPVVFGTSLQSVDLLRLNDFSRAKVVCSDLTSHDLSAGLVAAPCETSRTALRMADGSMINPTRGWIDGSFPRVLSPRRTKLLSSKPVLRWTAVAGVPAYRVIVRGADLYWASEVPSATEASYPDHAPRLKPGHDYKVIVETGNRSSSFEPGLGLGFSIIGPEERKTVLREEKQIENLGLAYGPTQFLMAHLYASHGLRAGRLKG